MYVKIKNVNIFVVKLALVLPDLFKVFKIFFKMQAVYLHAAGVCSA